MPPSVAASVGIVEPRVSKAGWTRTVRMMRASESKCCGILSKHISHG